MVARSSNAEFNEEGQAAIIRDIEEIMLRLEDDAGSNDLNLEAEDVNNDTADGGTSATPAPSSAATPAYLNASGQLNSFYASSPALGVIVSGVGFIATNFAGVVASGSLATAFDNSTGILTIPESGIYSVSLLLEGTVTNGVANSATIYGNVQGSTFFDVSSVSVGAVTSLGHSGIAGSVRYLAAGEQLFTSGVFSFATTATVAIWAFRVDRIA